MNRTIFLILFLAALLAISGMWAAKITVGSGDGYDYSSIQAAINAATAGDEIQVAPGTYTEIPSGSPYSTCIEMTKGVTLSSTGGAANTIIDAAGAYMGVSIPANVGTATIEGFTVTNFTHLGIAQSWLASVGTTSIIKNNVIQATNNFIRNGIQVSGNGSQVIGNTVYGASYATEDPNYGSSGILAVNASNVLIQGNTVTGPDLGITVQNFDYYEAGQTVSNVTVDDNDLSDCLLTGILLSGLDKESNDALANIKIINNEIHDNQEGIGTSGCAVTGLTVTGNDFADNYIHFINRQDDPVVIQDIIDGNTFDSFYVVDQTIYHNDPTTPVELASFTATISALNNVTLTWETQTETAMQGYYIMRATGEQLSAAEVVSPLIAATNGSQAHTYLYEDAELYENGTYFYWLQASQINGAASYHGPVSVFHNALGDNPTPGIPQVTELHAVYPNPFNPTAFIPYSLAKDSKVEFKIYNSRGQIVKHYDLGNKAAGNYRITWDGTDYNRRILANGVYQVVMTAGKEIYQTKAVLLK